MSSFLSTIEASFLFIFLSYDNMTVGCDITVKNDFVNLTEYSLCY